MHSVCIVRPPPPPRRSSVHMHVLGEVGSLVYTQANNGCGFSPRGTQSLVRDQRTQVLHHDFVVRYLDSHDEEDDILRVSMLSRFSP